MRITVWSWILLFALSASGASVVDRARIYGTEKHAAQSQLYDGHPYAYHLERVEAVLHRFGYSGDLLAAAWLHDVVEDTPTDIDEIEANFGKNVAGLVAAVTKRADKCATIMNVLSHPDGVILKLADRIANVEQGVAAGRILPKYIKDYPLFRGMLWRDGQADAMWATLDSLLR